MRMGKPCKVYIFEMMALYVGARAVFLAELNQRLF